MQNANATVQARVKEINLSESDIARFWSKVKIADSIQCWEWNAFIAKLGYGRFNVGGKARMAHRVAYAAHHGGVPTDKMVCHSCDNPKCVNPSHLFLGCQQDNMRDAVKKGRRAYIGDNAPNAKLKTCDVLSIKGLISQKVPFYKIAEMFSISPHHISAIHHKKTWKHLP